MRGEALGAVAFDRLLAWLDNDRDRAGETYERIRRKLTKFFEWRATSEAEELADRTIDRVSRKLEEGGLEGSADPTAYFFGVARNILREHAAEGARRHRALREFSREEPANRDDDASRDTVSLPRRLACLERCLSTLSIEDRGLITAYYEGEKHQKIVNRKALALRLGIPMNALWIRSHRVRLKLESCVEKCLESPSRERDDS